MSKNTFNNPRDIAISVEDLTKIYLVGHSASGDQHYTALRDVLVRYIRDFVRKTRDMLAGRNIVQGDTVEEFAALRDVSFQVERGEVLGIIGGNGAGKSTLLKILSRITWPTSGSIEINGKVASLLEVGTGFHPELSGRENIFLNGSILGMRKAEILKKFDEIVAFAGVERFIDTPVKRYSSGMYVRLAFSVAAHLEPEILIVDEVLAVGDAQFQKKCLEKMGSVGGEGKTVLFVSHNMTAIKNLCNRVIWLKNGSIYKVGDPQAITDQYLKESVGQDSLYDLKDRLSRLPLDPSITIETIEIFQENILTSTVTNSESILVNVIYSVHRKTDGLRIYFDVLDEDASLLIRSFNDHYATAPSSVDPGRYVSRATIPSNLLAPRQYELKIFATIFDERNIPPNGLSVSIFVSDGLGVNKAYPSDPVRSKLLPLIQWDTEKLK